MGRSERAGRWRSKTASFDAAYAGQPSHTAPGARAIPGAAAAEMAQQQRSMAGGSASSPPTHHSAWGWKEPGRKKDSDNWRVHPPPSAVLGAGANTAAGSSSSSSLGGAAAPTTSSSMLSGSLPVQATFADHSALAASAQGIPASSARARLLRTGALFAGSEIAGPAAPLNPLQIRNDAAPLDVRKRPLVHPSNSPRFGGENWALTPTSSLPSLPGTPQRTPAQARQHASTPADGSPVPRAAVSGFTVPSGMPGSSSRELVAARAVLNKRHDESGSSVVPPPPVQAATVPSSPSKPASATQNGLAPPHTRNLAVATGSPKRSPLSLAATSTPMLPPALPRTGRGLQPRSPGPSPRLAHRSISPPTESAANGSIASALTSSALTAGNVHSLLRRDSVASLASSHGGPGTHSLAHSRRASQVFSSAASAASPSSASIMSGAAPPRRPYRPPHLRNRESGQNLLPAVAHYDRVRTPSLRGISRSPDPSVAASSRAGSRPPSTVPLNPAAAEVAEMARHGLAGRRRLSSLGSFHTISDVEAMAPPTLHEGREATPEDYFTEHSRASSADRGSAPPPDMSSPDADAASSLDSRTLMAKLASTWSSRRSFAPSSTGGDDIAELSAELDDVDLSAEDMMTGTQSLTDGFCMSRQASHVTDARPVDIFEVGDRLGPGMMHDGLRIRIAQTSDGFREQPGDTNGKQLEVISKLGEGSYAVVYLVREVDPKPGGASASPEVAAANGVNMMQARAGSSASPPTPSALDDHDIYSRTLRASDVAMGDRTISSVADSSGSLSESDLQPPREFALKCLCKRDLSDEMLEVQRLEATIHQSIPQHPHIVTLYRTYETEDWLFLILEYCPGQDLYYWLEQAHDTENLGNGLSPGYTDSNSDASPGFADTDGDTSATFYVKGDQTVGDLTAGAARDSTPPSPSLLASTAGAALLSRKRLRLVSRMFQQMCDAVQFCHDRGISHRDLKPENFIVEDRRGTLADDSADSLDRSRGSTGRPSAATRRSSSFSMTRESMREFESRITVKLTDFGLAVAQDECVDFDCGSKPYMAYECRNNVADWYDPRQADIWSLGVVLLNLLFHRSPFAEPCAEACDSFAAFSYDPVRFLTQAFDGLSVEAAEFLADHVLCDVTNPRSDGSPRRRVSASELGAWAADLPRLLSTKDGQPRPSRGADTDITSPMVYSRTPSSSTLPSLFGSPLTFGTGQHTIHESMELEHDDIPNYPSLFPEYANGESSRDEPRRDRSVESLSPNVTGTPDILPSPTFSPPTRSLPLSGGSAPRSRPTSRVPSTEPEQVVRSLKTEPAVAVAATTEHSRQSSEDSDILANATPSSKDAASPTTETASDPDEHAGGASGETDVPSAHEAEAPRPIGNSKRRKRGARKGRNAANKQDKQLLRRSQSVEVLPSADLPAAPLGIASSSVPDPRDDILAQLAQASQDLARDLSRVSKYKSGGALRSGLSVSQPHTPASFGNAMPRSPIAVPQRTLARYGHEESGGADEGASYGSQNSRDYTSWLDRERSSASIANQRYADRAAGAAPAPWKAQLTTAPLLATNATSATYTKWESAAGRRDRVAGLTDTSDSSSWRERNHTLSHADTTHSDPALPSTQNAAAPQAAAAKASLLSMAHSLSAKKERANLASGVTVLAAGQEHVPASSLMPPPPVQKSGVSRFFSVRSRS